MSNGNSSLFEFEIDLPDKYLSLKSNRLVGYKKRYDQMHQDLRLLLDKDGLEQWSNKQYGHRICLLDSILDRYPLIIFHGDVGTGKTATAESIANELTKELGKEARLFKLSTRVRGGGNVGEMSKLINDAFEIVCKEAGKTKLSFLIIDEADSLAAHRSDNQSHHEDKVAVNTLIQKIDDARRFIGRVIIILCTNLYDALDPAIIRRASYIEEFKRPDDEERFEIFNMDCNGLNLPSSLIEELVNMTGSNNRHNLGYTFSDIRTRLLPDALAKAYPSRQISKEDLIQAVNKISPSPSINKTKGES